jgi:pSer/pThr/pTyr-binding forkhead associated (FHA) protein
MDDSPHADTIGFPVQGPHRPLDHVEPLPADFVPLRLILQPTGMVVELTRADVIVGRHSEADVRLPLPDVSRRHCRFVFGNGNWVVMDLNSLNGIYVNDELVGQATLKQGDRLRIGGFLFAVDLARPGQPAEAHEKPDIVQNIFDTHRGPKTFTPHRRAS